MMRLVACGAAVLLAAVMLPAILVTLMAGGLAAEQAACGTTNDLGPLTSGDAVAGKPLGGVHGTGVPAADYQATLAFRKGNVSEGTYVASAYGPPWGGIQGAGIATAAGIRLNGGNPALYIVAVDPSVTSLGRLVNIWPNPFAWNGKFLTADTGSAIKGRRIDFYDWRGRTTQNAWGMRQVTLSTKPHPGGGLAPDFTSPTSSGEDCEAVSVGDGTIPAIARRYLGKDGRTQPFTGFKPATFNDQWCSWFATNVWRLAGIPIPTMPFTGDAYTWGQEHGYAWKPYLQKPKGRTPPVGSLLFYGPSPASGQHVNIVEDTYPDGSIRVIGGNQGSPGRVTHYGPCRFTATNPAYSSCDGRPIFGIIAPPTGQEA